MSFDLSPSALERSELSSRTLELTYRTRVSATHIVVAMRFQSNMRIRWHVFGRHIIPLLPWTKR